MSGYAQTTSKDFILSNPQDLSDFEENIRKL